MQFKKVTLANGLTLLMDFMPQIESLTIRLLFKVGSLDELNRVAGISHIVEHMLFKGTTKRSAKEIAEDLDMVGGYLNAYTSKEKTVYYTKVLKQNLNLALDILSDIVRFSTYDTKELNTEKTVIKQEIADSEDTPEDVLFDSLWKTAFPNHQIGQAIAGTQSSVDSCTREDLIAFTQDFYTPSNAFLSISGNFNEQEFIQLVEDKFASWSGAYKSEVVQSVPVYLGGETKIIKPIEQVHVALAFPGVSLHSPDYYLHQVTALIAGGSMSSRLFQEIREKAGLAYSISAFASSYSNCGLWGVYAATNPQSLNNLLDLTISELKKMRDNITEKELISAKAQIKSGLLMSLESSSNRAEKLVSNFATFNRLISHAEIIEAIDQITVLSVQNLITSMLLQGDKCTFIVVGNIDSLYSYPEIIAKFYD
jgi:predicted Zn-dependent peptidase